MNIQSISASLPTQIAHETIAMPREAKIVVPAQDKAVSVQVAQPAQAEPPEKDTKPASQEQLQAAVESVREYVQPFNNNIEFSISDETKGVVVKIVDSATKEVIRQIPSEEMIAIAKALDSIKGLFIKQMA